MFDITSKAVKETGLVLLNDAEGAPLMGEGGQCAIEVYGPGSKEYARAEANRSNKAVDRLKRRGKSKASAEEQRAEQADFLSDITIGLQHFGYSPAGEATGKELYRQLYMDRRVGYVADQVQEYVGDWGNFTGASETSSSTSSGA